jgi:hypothetical protein
MSASYIAALETENYRLRAENEELKNRLRDIIKEAVQEAIQPLQDRIESQDARIAAQDEKIAALESTQEHDVNRICLDICQDRQRLAKLEKVEPQPMQKDRGDILRALLAANGGKMLAKDARQKMHLSCSRFSELITTLKNDIEIKPYHLKRNQNILVLK